MNFPKKAYLYRKITPKLKIMKPQSDRFPLDQWLVLLLFLGCLILAFMQ